MRSNIRLHWLLPIRSIMFIFTFLIIHLMTGDDLADLTYWWSTVASGINIVVIVGLILIADKNKMTYAKLINYKKRNTKISIIVIISISMLVVGMGGMYLAGFICYQQFPYLAPMMIAPIPIILAIINLFVLPISTTLAEDGLYLGCGVNQIKSKWQAILIPAFFYALQHCFIPTIFNQQYILYRFLSFLPLTILICYWYYHKKNPLPIMVGHTVLNIATVIQILMMSLMPELYSQLLSI